jgi:hypothetical protein
VHQSYGCIGYVLGTIRKYRVRLSWDDKEFCSLFDVMIYLFGDEINNTSVMPFLKFSNPKLKS